MRRVKRNRHLPYDLVGLELVETWRCEKCGRKFRRKRSLNNIIGKAPPQGFDLHGKVCRRKARELSLDDDPT